MDKTQETVEFVNGIDQGSLAHSMLVILFLLVVFAVIIFLGVWLARQSRDINNFMNTATNNQKEPTGESKCE